MRALVYDGAGITLDRNRPEPQAGPRDAVVSVARVGVSRCDVEVCRGMLGFRGVVGHEFVGLVERVADDRDEPLVGRRVVGSHVISCGECDLCTGGLATHCRNRALLGMQGRDGCLADFVAIPARNLAEVPESVDNDRAVFASTVACALQAARQITIEGRPYITVLGDGPLGLSAVQVMAKLNASVRLIGQFSEKLALCEKWGVKHRHVDDIGRRADQDVVVDCTGSPEGLTLATELVRPRGKIVLTTMISPETLRAAPEFDPGRLVAHEIQVLGSHAGPLREALGAIERGEVDVLSLISRRMRLDDGAEILRAADRPETIKVLVDV